MVGVELAGRVAESKSGYGKYFSENYEQNGSPKGYDLEAIFNNPQENVDKICALAKYYYAKVGLIMRVVNIIRDFGVGKPIYHFPTKNKKVKKIINDFNERVAVEQVLKDIVFELALTGNCAGYDRDGERVDIYPVTRVKVSPLIIGNKPVLIWKHNLSDINYLHMDLDALAKKLELAYPQEVVDGIRQGKDQIILNTDNSFFVKTNSSRYEPYGLPFLLAAFDELAHKTMLKEAERATATGIIEKVFRISVGDKDHAPKQEEIDFYNGLINNKSGSLKVTVPYFVDMKWIEPDTEIFGEKKFVQVDKDLLSALGVSLTLIRGEGGGNYSEGVISLTGLIKTITSIREPIPAVVRQWHQAELKRHGLGAHLAPTMELPAIDIDQAAKMQMTQWLFEHAGLPYQLLYEDAGYDYLTVKLTREEENEQKLEDTFKLREQPYQGASDAGGRPEKTDTERKTDRSMANNDQPRPSTR